LAGVLLFVPLAVLAGIVTLFTVGQDEATPAAVVDGMPAALVLGSAVCMGLRRGLPRRLAAGILAGLVVTVLVAVGVSLLSRGAATNHLQRIADSSAVPIYSLGPRFHGWTLDDVGIDSGSSNGSQSTDRRFDSGDDLFLIYGETCPAIGGLCSGALDVDENTNTTSTLTALGRCMGFERISGLPALRTKDGDLWIFVGRMRLHLDGAPGVVPAKLAHETLASLRRIDAHGSLHVQASTPPPSLEHPPASDCAQ